MAGLDPESVFPELSGRTREEVLRDISRRLAELDECRLADGLGVDAYWRQRTWKRIAAIAAGPLTNLVFAVVLLATEYMLGIPSDASRKVGDVIPGTPAVAAGLKAGDRIIGVNRVPAADFSDVRDAIRNSNGSPLVLSIVRDGRYYELRPVRPTKTNGVYTLGFHPAAVRYKHYDPARAAVLAAAAIGVLQIVTDVLFSTKTSDWKKFRRERAVAKDLRRR